MSRKWLAFPFFVVAAGLMAFGSTAIAEPGNGCTTTSGRPITWLSRHLRHATLEITASTYGHWERAEQRKQAEQMEGVFGV